MLLSPINHFFYTQYLSCVCEYMLPLILSIWFCFVLLSFIVSQLFFQYQRTSEPANVWCCFFFCFSYCFLYPYVCGIRAMYPTYSDCVYIFVCVRPSGFVYYQIHCMICLSLRYPFTYSSFAIKNCRSAKVNTPESILRFI